MVLQLVYQILMVSSFQKHNYKVGYNYSFSLVVLNSSLFRTTRFISIAYNLGEKIIFPLIESLTDSYAACSWLSKRTMSEGN